MWEELKNEKLYTRNPQRINLGMNLILKAFLFILWDIELCPLHYLDISVRPSEQS